MSEPKSFGARLKRRISRDFFHSAVPNALSRSWMQRFWQFNFRLSLSGMNIETWTLSMRDERAFFKRYFAGLGPHPVVFDVGANTGQFAGIVKGICPGAAVYSFEPNPACHEALFAVGERLGTTVETCGLGAEPGTAELFDRASTPGSEHASLVAGVIDQLHQASVSSVTVTIDTIDRYADAHGVARIDVLKVDVEGFELDVMKGASRMLAEGRIESVQVEFNTMNVLSHSFVRDFMELLPGFGIYRLLGDGSLYRINDLPIYARELFGYQNLIALKESTSTS